MKVCQKNRNVIALAVMLGLSACSQKAPEELMSSAQQKVQLGDKEAAIIELKNAIALSPDFSPARLELGKLYTRTGRLPAAEKELRKALELGAPAEEVVPLLVYTYYHLDQFETARSLAEESTLNQPQAASTVALYGYLSSLRGVTGDPQDLASVESNLLEEDLQVAKAYRYFRDKNYALTEQLIEQWDSDGERKAEMYFVHGLLDFKLQDYPSALEHLSEAKQAMPYINSVNFILIEAMINAKRFEQAQIETNRLYKVNAKHPLINKYKAKIEQNAGNYLAALRHAEEAIQGGMDSLDMRVLAGLSAYREKVYERAYRHLRVAAQRPGDHTDAVNRVLSNVQLNLGYNLEAAKTLQSLTATTKEDAKLFAMTGTEFALAGDEDAAQQLLEQAATLDGASGDVKLRQAMLQAGKDDDATVELLREAVVLDEDLNFGWMQIAMAHLRKGDKDAALKAAEDWSKVDTVSGKVLEGFVYLSVQEFKKSREILNGVLQDYPEHIGAHFYVLHGYAKQNNQQKRLEKAKDVLTLDPDNIRALVSVIDAAVKTQQQDSAEMFLRQLSQENDNLAPPLEAIALMQKESGNANSAIDMLSGIENKTPFGYIALSNAQAENSDFQASFQTLQTMHERFPRSVLPLTKMAALKEREGNDKEALALIDKASAIQPKNRELKLARLHYLTKLNRVDEANVIINELEDKDLARGGVLMPLYAGQIALNDNNYAKAERILGEYHNNNPTYPSALMLAKSLLSQGKANEAKAVINDQLTREDNPPDRFVEFAADFFSYVKDFDRAAQMYGELASQHSENPNVLNNYAYNLMKAGGDLSEAKSAAAKAVSLSPTNPYLKDTLGVIESRLGNTDQAYKLMSEAVAKVEDNNQMNLNFAELLIEMGLGAKAKDYLARVSQPTKEEAKQLERLNRAL